MQPAAVPKAITALAVVTESVRVAASREGRIESRLL